MQTLTQTSKLPPLVEVLIEQMRSQLTIDFPELSAANQESIVCWLLGEDLTRWETLNASQTMTHLYQILHQRYLGKSPKLAYCNLITQLGTVILRNQIYTGVSNRSDRAITNLVPQLILNLLQSDRYLHQQMTWIAQCTRERQLQNTLLLATVEEYCLRPIPNQPLLIYRFIELYASYF